MDETLDVQDDQLKQNGRGGQDIALLLPSPTITGCSSGWRAQMEMDSDSSLYSTVCGTLGKFLYLSEPQSHLLVTH
jgi:hypothetical protein